MKRVYIRTFGCQMNCRDSEFIKGIFVGKGYRLSDSPKGADVIIFNTCSVRKHAEERAISNMGYLMHRYKDKKYGMVGCAAQALKSELFKRLPGLNIVCGTGEIAKLPKLVEKVTPRSRLSALKDINKPLPELGPAYRESDRHAHVSIMRGCNNFCSYCIVPYVRGREHSRKPQNIINEVRRLVERGIKDITLLGQNVNSYRPEPAGLRTAGRKQRAYNFVDLLKDISKVEGLRQIRFITSHPKDASVPLFKAMRDFNNVAKHLHLPLQSGSDRILKLMKRGYTRSEYYKQVNNARKIVPDLRLTTDIIVGFPTETEKDFNDTLKLMKKIRFDLAYIFKYSPRPGTEAAGMTDDVPEENKKIRHNVILNLQRGISKRKRHEEAVCSCIN